LLSALEFGISAAMAVAGLRGIWKLQHSLDLRGYLLQAGLFLLGLVMALVGFYMPAGLTRAIVFDCGILSMAVFLLLPEAIYRLMRFYDRQRGSQA
jgi:hypothetical protein